MDIRHKIRTPMLMACLFIFGALPSNGQDEWLSHDELKKRVSEEFGPPQDCKKLDKENPIWIHRDDQVVVTDGFVVQRDVPLELFACPTGSKEHEAIVAVFARARTVHAGLLAINAKPGSPATFEPFKPASGTTVRVYTLWFADIDGKKVPKGTLAQNWIRRSGTKKPMAWDFVFAGSGLVKDDEGKEHYLGDSGELISVSNFASSTMDVAVKSDQANASLLFEAFTDRIPKRNTPVRLVLALTDEPPFGTYKDVVDKKDADPKHLTEKIPDRIMRYLVPANPEK